MTYRPEADSIRGDPFYGNDLLIGVREILALRHLRAEWAGKPIKCSVTRGDQNARALIGGNKKKYQTKNVTRKGLIMSQYGSSEGIKEWSAKVDALIPEIEALRDRRRSEIVDQHYLEAAQRLAKSSGR